MAIEINDFGYSKEGFKLHKIVLKNTKGMQAVLSDLGASLIELHVPDRDGKDRDVVLGYDNAEGYYKDKLFLGAIVGRCCNRIDQGRFTLNGKTYQLEQNENENTLHSGSNSYRQRVWTLKDQGEMYATFELFDPALSQGFPGDFTLSLTYTLTEENELKLHYLGKSTEDTVVNLTNHSYFNLDGQGSGNVLDTWMRIFASEYTPDRDSKSIPTGEIVSVEGTPMDFREMKQIGKDVEAPFDQLIFTGGYDHNYLLDGEKGEMNQAAEAYSDRSGIEMKVFTDLPALQFYIGNFIDEGTKGKRGAVYGYRGGFCLETQYCPNAINQPAFASTILRAGEEFDSTTIFRFGIR